MRSKRVGSLLVAVVAARILAITSAAGAGAGPADAAPVLHCSWALVDSGAADHGPDVLTPPTSTGAACALDAAGVAHQTPNAPGLAHVSLEQPATASRELDLWTAVSHPTSDAFGSGAGTVTWTIRQPDGLTVDEVTPIGRSCAGETEPGPMWNAVSVADGGTGALATDVVTNEHGTGLWQECRQGRVRIFHGRAQLPPDAPCGSYSVTTSASVGAATTSLDFGFDVVCPADLSLDASSIAWSVEPGGSATIDGDLDASTTGQPTLTNVGSGPAQIGVIFTALRRDDRPDAIAQFGVMLTSARGDVTGISRLAADTEGWLSGSPSVLCPGASVRLDLTVYTPPDIAPGEYSGSIRVIARPGGRC